MWFGTLLRPHRAGYLAPPFVELYVRLTGLHSFPTRRSSDLPSTRSSRMSSSSRARWRGLILLTSRAGTAMAVPARDVRRNKPLRSEEHTSELQSPDHLVCHLLLDKQKQHRPLVCGNPV